MTDRIENSRSARWTQATRAGFARVSARTLILNDRPIHGAAAALAAERLVQNRPIYVLDEWAANQDHSFKRVFYDEILPEMKAAGKALLVISHDERYFGIADRVIRLEEGRLVDALVNCGDACTQA